ncbi:MAG: DEAD/DEAH box helicase, partial [Pseudomonadales bacterium]|nr:DEAD/DEAH box helicase [Pseudomonadales bacterium]
MSFKNFSFNPSLCAALDSAGYRSSTPLNETIIPHYLNSEDLYICAPIGSGKTTTSLICAINQLLQEHDDVVALNTPSVIVLAPTREQKNHTIRTRKEICRFLP